MFAQNNNTAGLVQTGNAGNAWNYSSSKGLVSQMYGKLSHAGPTQYDVSQYLCSLSHVSAPMPPATPQ